MGQEFRLKYLEKTYRRYQKASKASKGRILDELCKVCGYDRKYAIWKLNRLAAGQKRKKRKPRARVYDEAVLWLLEKIWEAANYPWSARLKEILRLWLPWAKKHFVFSPETERKLLSMSPSTMDRALKYKKNKIKRRLYGKTKPGTLLKHQIPVKTDSWDVSGPGFVEVDLVSHSGPNASGEFLHSVNLTDIFSTWVETRAVMGKGERGVLAALSQMREALPFALLGLDSDNGSEFINYHLVRYCQKEAIQLTRSRPYEKNDNAHIEQKNWTHVRRLLGWNRYDSMEAQETLNAFYQNEYRWFMNFFQPSVKLKEITRVGSRVKRKYDCPRTALDRLLDSGLGDKAKLSELKELRDSMDPFVLSEKVNRVLRKIWRLDYRPIHDAQSASSGVGNSYSLSSVELRTFKQLSKIFGFPVLHTKQDQKRAGGSHG
jgi:hypothetical protein